MEPSTSSAIYDEADLSALIEAIDDADDEEWVNGVVSSNNLNRSLNATTQLDTNQDDFDKNAGTSWIYPIGYEKREYQMKISQTCLFNNTLVCLPTGLGKTFIASVVIYNYYRWFPRSKIIFMAPSRPLVTQQIEACYDIIGVSPDETAEMTGRSNPESRMVLWNTKRLFYATPQTIENDISNPQFPVNDIKLIIVDEAHKAKKNFSYCGVIRGIHQANKNFRIVALSATPGKTADVIQVIQNLLISKIEIRNEKSPDVNRYSFTKDIIVEQVKLGELQPIRDRYISLTDDVFRKLLEHKVIQSNYANKGWVIMQHKKFCETGHAHPQRNEISTLFSIAVSVLHSLGLLEQHGIQSFIKSFFDEKTDKLKYFVLKDRQLRGFIEELIQKYDGTSPLTLNIHPLPNGEVPSIDDSNIIYGHPKFDRLKMKVKEYFDNGGNKTIIFCEFRDTVQMVYTLLLQLRPNVLPKMLIGQSGVVTQKEQLAVMKDFRSDKVNVLITTSVCEEGIDVGEVDMVICFDMNSKNPTRYVQRIGRTGRKRNGKVIMLATEGREEDTIREVIGSKDKMNKSIHTNKEIAKNYYKNSPRMIPGGLMPRCVETRFTIPDKVEDVKPDKKAKKAAKAKKIPVPANTRSIAEHFKPRSKSANVDALGPTQIDNVEAADQAQVEIEPVCVAPEPQLPMSLQFAKDKQKFEKDVEKVLIKVEQNLHLVDHIRAKSKRDMKMMENFLEMFTKSSIADASFQSDLDNLLNVSVKIKKAPIKAETPKAAEPIIDDFNESPEFIEVDSRYGNQFSNPEPFNTPSFRDSPFKPVNQITNSAVKATPPTRYKRIHSGRFKTPIQDSPLMKAFEKQRNISTSTPNTSKMSSFTRTASAEKFSFTKKTSFNKNTSFDYRTMQAATTSATASEVKEKPEDVDVLKFFGLTSIEDLFDNMDDDEVSSSIIQVTSEPGPKDSIAQLLNEDNDSILLEDEIVPSSIGDEIVPSSIGDEIVPSSIGDEIVPSSINEHSIVESSVVEIVTPVKKINTRVIEPNPIEFNLDEIFGNSNEEPEHLDDKLEIGLSDASQKTEEYEVDSSMITASFNVKSSPIKENVLIVNSCVIQSPSPEKFKARQRPNFAKLSNALKSSNFLSPTFSQPSTSGYNLQPSYAMKVPDLHLQVNNSPIRPSTSHTSIYIESPVSSRAKKLSNDPIQLLDSIECSDDAVNERVSFALPVRRKVSKKRKRNGFLCTQAGVDGTDSSDDDDDSLDGFIQNESLLDTQDADVDDDMRAKYLKSLNSPSARQNGRFKIPQLQPSNITIFSQAPQDEEEDDWEMDSFVVNTQSIEHMDSEPDELEIAERRLKEMRKRQRQLKHGIKRRKVVRVEESSDEEDCEMKKLRQHLEENPDTSKN